MVKKKPGEPPDDKGVGKQKRIAVITDVGITNKMTNTRSTRSTSRKDKEQKIGRTNGDGYERKADGHADGNDDDKGEFTNKMKNRRSTRSNTRKDNEQKIGSVANTVHDKDPEIKREKGVNDKDGGINNASSDKEEDSNNDSDSDGDTDNDTDSDHEDSDSVSDTNSTGNSNSDSDSDNNSKSTEDEEMDDMLGYDGNTATDDDSLANATWFFEVEEMTTTQEIAKAAEAAKATGWHHEAIAMDTAQAKAKRASKDKETEKPE